MRGADPRRNSPSRNSRRPGGRNDGSEHSRRGTVKPHHTGKAPSASPTSPVGWTDSRTDKADAVRAAAASTSDSLPGKGKPEPTSKSPEQRVAAATVPQQRTSATSARGANSSARRRTGTLKEYFAGMDKARLRHFGLSVIGADGAVVLAAIVLAILGIVIAGAGIVVLPATIASIWMLFNLGGIGYNGTMLSMLPAVPAMVMVAFIAWRVRREVAGRVSIRDVRALVSMYIVVPLLLTFIAWLMLVDAANVLQRLKVPNVGMALGCTFVLHATAVVIGMGQRLIRALLRRRSWPEWLILSARLASQYILWLGIAGLIVALVSIGWHFGAFRQAYDITNSLSDKILLTLLSIGYLPNIAMSAVGVLVGGPANIGPAEVTLFTVTPAKLPPLPILAAVPQSHISMAFGALLVIPVLIAVWRVLHLLRTVRLERPYIVVVVGAVMSGVFAGLISLLFSGEVGIYGWSGPSWWLTALLVSVWLAAPGAIVVAVAMGLPTRAAGTIESEIAAEKLPADEVSRDDGDATDASEAGAKSHSEAESESGSESTSESAAKSKDVQEAASNEAAEDDAEAEAGNDEIPAEDDEIPAEGDETPEEDVETSAEEKEDSVTEDSAVKDSD